MSPVKARTILKLNRSLVEELGERVVGPSGSRQASCKFLDTRLLSTSRSTLGNRGYLVWQQKDKDSNKFRDVERKSK